jgi:hypothetical protein
MLARSGVPLIDQLSNRHLMSVIERIADGGAALSPDRS